MTTASSPFEDHLERVLPTCPVALAIHRVSPPDCQDYAHLTALDQQRTQAAIEALEASDAHSGQSEA